MLTQEKLYKHLYRNQEEKVAEYSKADLFKATMHYDDKVSQNAIGYLQKFHSRGTIKECPIQKGAEIVLVGSSGYFKFRELRERLLPLGIECKIRVKESTTHVVLSPGSQKDKGLLKHDVTILTPKELSKELERLEEPYLLEENEDNQETMKHLGELFLSNQEENITLALELVKGAGIPKELLTDILIAYKSGMTGKIREKVKKLLYAHIEVSSREAVRKLKGLNSYSTERVLVKGLGDLARTAPEFDSIRIGKYMHEHYEVGTNFLLTYLPTQEALKWLELYVNGNELDFSNTHFSSFPIVATRLTSLTSVNLRNCRFPTVPVELSRLPNLEKLDMAYNGLKALSPHLANNQKLKVLSVGHNHFKKVPKVLFKMSQLEELHIRFDASAWNISKNLRKEMEELRKTLPNCKIVTNK